MKGDAYLEQRDDLFELIRTNLQRISESPLPVVAKIDAINKIIMSKFSFYFPNMPFPDIVLKQIETGVVFELRAWLTLNKSGTCAFMFIPRKQGGLGILQPMTMYYAKRVSFLLSVLNSQGVSSRRR